MEAEDVCKTDSPELQAQTLKDLLNFNEAGETAITIFIGAVEGLSVGWSGHGHETELMTYVSVDMPDY